MSKNHELNIKPLEKACRSIKKYLREGNYIVIQSTVNPGVFEEMVKSILGNSGLKGETDFNIAHWPQKIAPVNKAWTINNILVFVGATTPKGLQRPISFYMSMLGSDMLPLISKMAVEPTKILVNSFRDAKHRLR